MSLSKIIDAMVASGCSAEQVAAVVRAHEAEREQEAAERRAKDAARQRKSRMSRNVTVTPCDSQEKAPPFSPLSPTPPIPPISPQKTTLLNGREAELYDALGEHANQRANGRFLALSEPLNWLNSGCDMDADILPTVRALSAKSQRITSWKFFDAAVFEARDRRLAPAPDVQPRQAAPPRPGVKRTFMDAYRDLENERSRTVDSSNVVSLPANNGRT